MSEFLKFETTIWGADVKLVEEFLELYNLDVVSQDHKIKDINDALTHIFLFIGIANLYEYNFKLRRTLESEGKICQKK